MDPSNPNVQKWLHLIRVAEGTVAGGPYAKTAEDSYRVIYGGEKFSDFSRHPDKVVRKGYTSAAAGAYQFLPGTWNRAAKALGLKDFSPRSQDLAAVQLMRWRGIDPTKDPITKENIAKLANEWASLPNLQGRSAYGQPVKSVDTLLGAVNSYRPSPSVAASAPKPTTASGTPQVGSVGQKKSKGAGPKASPRNFLQETMKNLPSMFGLINSAPVPEDAAEDIDIAMALDAQGSPLADVIYDRALNSGDTEGDIGSGLPEELPALFAALLDSSRNLSGDSQPRMASVGGAPPVQETVVVPAQQTAYSAPIVYKGAILTSAKDATGEPGLDFVIPGGRGAKFLAPFDAEVVEVKGGQNWETNLERNPSGKRGYGNYVDLRAKGPDGKPFDIRLAHFDALNPDLRPGMRISAGTKVGTQGRTGSTTGAHVSMDFYDPGKTTTSPSVLRLRDQMAARIRQGIPLL